MKYSIIIGRFNERFVDFFKRSDATALLKVAKGHGGPSRALHASMPATHATGCLLVIAIACKYNNNEAGSVVMFYEHGTAPSK